MANIKISQYTPETTVQQGDLFDISEHIGGSNYQTRSITFDNLKRSMNTSTTQTGDYTLGVNDVRVDCDCTSNAIDITLPNIADSIGRLVCIKKTDSSTNVVTIAGDANIDGDANYTLNAEGSVIWLSGTTSQWEVVNERISINGDYVSIVVSNETEFVNAFTTIGNTLGGGNIILIDTITLTADRTLDHSGIRVLGNNNFIVFGAYKINVSSRVCEYENTYFQGPCVGLMTQMTQLFAMTNSTNATSSYTFNRCRWYNAVSQTNAGNIPVVGTGATHKGSFHLSLLNNFITSPSGISTAYFTINPTSSAPSGTDVFSLTVSTPGYAGELNLSYCSNYKPVGTPLTAGNFVYSDGSVNVVTSVLTGTKVFNAIAPGCFENQRTYADDNEIINIENDLLLIDDFSDQVVRKISPKDLVGSVVKVWEDDDITITSGVINHTLFAIPDVIIIRDSSDLPISLDIITAQTATSLTIDSLQTYNNAKIKLIKFNV